MSKPILQIWDEESQKYVPIPAIKGKDGKDGAPGKTGPRGAAFTYADFTAEQLAALKGPKGDKGDKGDTGAPGAGLSISGSVANYGSLPKNLTAADAGKAYFVETDGKLYIWSGSAFPAEGEGSQFKGDKGDKGDTGDTGPQGPKGATGETGPRGAAGKSAYASAQDGGYTGTEAAFNAALAAVSDKQPKITANGLLKGNGSGGVSAATKGTDYAGPSRSVAVTLPASGWNADTKTQTVSVTGMTTSANCIITAAPGSYMAYAEAGVRCTAQGSGSLTFACETVPTEDVATNVLILG